MSRKLDKIVTELGNYYGVSGKDSFISKLLATRANNDTRGFFEIAESTEPEKFVQLLNDLIEGGLTSKQLITQASDIESGGEAIINDVIKVLYEPDDNTESSMIIDNSQGIPPEEGRYSLKRVAGIPTKSSINNADGAVYTGSKTLSAFQVLSSRFTPANRDTGALSLFLNAMPTLEISRAIPFIDIVLIQPGENIQDAGGGQSRMSKLSLGYFLIGGEKFGSGSPQADMLGAKDSIISRENKLRPTALGGGRQAKNISTAGMELFTSPQTLVNATENFHDYGSAFKREGTTGGTYSGNRPTPIIDKFRPLMSLEGLDITAQPTGGLMSYKTAKMTLILHDRSRLSEVSAFVNPGAFGQTHISLGYGWAHPDADILLNSDNLFGQFIGNLRCREKYHVYNSSFSFEPDGQVRIELDLAMLSERAVTNIQIGMGEGVRDKFKEVKSLTDNITKIKSSMGKGVIKNINGDGNIVGALSDPSRALSIDEETKGKIRQTIKKYRGKKGFNELITQMERLVGVRKGSDSAIESFQSTVKQEINRKLNHLRDQRNGDPFFIDLPGAGIGRNNNTGQRPTYISLGKLLLSFMGAPIASSDYYDDVQVIFYNFNDKASYMKNKNIASFPVNINEFGAELEKYANNIENIPLGGLVNFLDDFFVSDPASKAYGFSSLYDERDEDNRKKRQLKEEYEDGQKYYEEEQRILKEAYGSKTDTDELVFMPPAIQMYMETVPIDETVNDRLGVEDGIILRIHIYDKKCTSYTTERDMLNSLQDDQIGLINPTFMSIAQNDSPSSLDRQKLKEGVKKAWDMGIIEPYPPTTRADDPDILKNNQTFKIRDGLLGLKKYLMRTMPVVRYGEGTSAVLNADLSSLNDSSLGTIMMQRQGNTLSDPPSAQKTGLPMTVHPVELTLTTIGCPLWQRGQQIFVDFGTGTTADNIYAVNELSHAIKGGEFKTTVRLLQIDGYGKYRSLLSNINQAIVAAYGAKEQNDPSSGG